MPQDLELLRRELQVSRLILQDVHLRRRESALTRPGDVQAGLAEKSAVKQKSWSPASDLPSRSTV